MSKKALIGGGVVLGLAVLGGGGYFMMSNKAESMTREGLENFRSTISSKADLTWGKIESAPFSQSVTVHDLKLKAKDGGDLGTSLAPGASMQGMEQSMERFGEGLDDESMARLKAMEARPDELTIDSITVTDPGEKSTGQVLFSGISFSNEEEKSEISISSMQLDEIKLDGDLSKVRSGKPGDLVTLVDMEHARVDNFDVSVDGEKVLLMESYTIDGYDNGRIADMSLNNYTLQNLGPLTKMTAENFVIRGVDMAFVDDAEDEEKMAMHVANMFGASEAIGKNLVMVIDGKELGGKPMEILIAEVGQYFGARVDGLATDQRMVAKGITVDVTELMEKEPDFAAMMKDVGQEKLELGLEIASKLGTEEQTFTFGPLALEATGMGRIHMEAGFTEVDPDQVRQYMQGDPSVLAKFTGKLASAKVSYDDDRLADHLVEKYSEGAPREAFAQGMAMQAQMMLMGQGNKLAQDAGKAVQAFLMGTSRFEITVNPETPLGLPDLMQAEASNDIGTLLNVSISGE